MTPSIPTTLAERREHLMDEIASCDAKIADNEEFVTTLRYLRHGYESELRGIDGAVEAMSGDRRAPRCAAGAG